MESDSKSSILLRLKYAFLSFCFLSVLVYSGFGQIKRLVPRPIKKFTATSYCGVGRGCKYGGKTASGIQVKRGVLAADPRVIPLKSVVRIISPLQYAGFYTVEDTGSAIKRDIIDLWVPRIAEARAFGRRPVWLQIYPKGTTLAEAAGLVDLPLQTNNDRIIGKLE